MRGFADPPEHRHSGGSDRASQGSGAPVRPGGSGQRQAPTTLITIAMVHAAPAAVSGLAALVPLPRRPVREMALKVMETPSDLRHAKKVDDFDRHCAATAPGRAGFSLLPEPPVRRRNIPRRGGSRD